MTRLAVLLAFLPVTALAAPLTYLVGSDVACDYTTVQAAVNAAASHPGPDVIRVATNKSYAAQAIKVGTQDLEIHGGFATCASAAPAPHARTTLSGLGGTLDSVIEFTGSGTRVLVDLMVSRGDDTVSGGGIQYDGNGDLILRDVGVSQNAAPHGGGINFHGNGGRATLTFLDGVVIQNNTAHYSGGGVRLTGSAHLSMRARDSTIIGNVAKGSAASNEGFGGGLLVLPPARAHIASPGRANFAAIEDNEARVGGGIAVRARPGGWDFGYVLLYTVDPQRPVRVANNRATELGGGGFVSSGGTFEDHAEICAHEFVWEGNSAPSGGAIASRGREGTLGGIAFNAEGCKIYGVLGDDAVTCNVNAGCNEIRDNRSEDARGVATSNPVIEVGLGMFLNSLRVAYRRNVGGTLLRLDRQTAFTLGQSLLADNASSGFLVAQAESALRAELRYVTIAGNVIGGDAVLSLDAPQRLERMVVAQPGVDVLNAQGNPVETAYLLVSSCGLIPCGGTVTSVVTGPRFMDPAGGDYHLHPASRAVDAAPLVREYIDLDGHPRRIDLPEVPNRDDATDLGAYETTSMARLVRNGAFPVDMRFWAEVTPGTVAWDATGEDGAGGVRVHDDVNPALTSVVGLRQCVPVPGPGTYAVTGFALGDGLLGGRDRPRIHWRYFRRTTSNDCTGTATAEGDALFAAVNGWTFAVATIDNLIEVEADTFNERTQIELTLIVDEGAAAIGTSTAARFDGINLVRRWTPEPTADGLADDVAWGSR